MKEKQKSDFQKYLLIGYSLQDACACAGITLDEARKIVAEAQSDFEDWELLRQHGTKKIQKALDILDNLMDSEDDGVRLGAVRTLIQIMKPITNKQLVKIEASSASEDLWSLAKKGTP